LHNEIIKRCNAYYGNLPVNDLLVGFMAELINQKWYEQWLGDWLYAKQLRVVNKKKFLGHQIDLVGLSKGQILTQKRMERLTKKQKSQQNVNNHALGFTLGFTRSILRETN